MDYRNTARLLQEQFAGDPNYDFDLIVTNMEVCIEGLNSIIKDAAHL